MALPVPRVDLQCMIVILSEKYSLTFCNAVQSTFFYFCNHLAEEERVGCFALSVFFLSC